MCNVKIVDYTIPKFCLNVESLMSGEHRFSLNINVNVMIPKDANEKECVAEITIRYSTDDDVAILSAIVRARVVVEGMSTDEEKCDAIKAEVVPVIYNRLRNFIGDTIEKTHIGLPNIPKVEDVNI